MHHQNVHTRQHKVESKGSLLPTPEWTLIGRGGGWRETESLTGVIDGGVGDGVCGVCGDGGGGILALDVQTSAHAIKNIHCRIPERRKKKKSLNITFIRLKSTSLG